MQEITSQFAFYEITGNSSDIFTVVNTSILPYSYENTEREFSPFSTSPLISPRLPFCDSMPTAILTTETTIKKNKCKIVKIPEIVLTEEEKDIEEDCEEFENERSNYLNQHRGDNETPSYSYSAGIKNTNNSL